MKITLVQPPMTVNDLKSMPQVQPPLGLGYLAASVRQEGHVVRVVDGVGEGIGRHSKFRDDSWIYGLPIDEVVDRIDDDTEVLGVGIMFSNFWPISKMLIRALRARFPHAVIVCGGEHVSALPDFVLNEAPIDYAVMGEGEETLCELLAHLGSAPGSLPVERIAGLELALRRRRDRPDATAATPPNARRDSLAGVGPVPDRSIFRRRAVRVDGVRIDGTRDGDHGNARLSVYLHVLLERADVGHQLLHARSQGRRRRDGALRAQTYGATDFHFQDLTLIINRRWTHQLCDEILRRNLGITWKTTSGTRSEALDLELLEKIAASGCDELTLAPDPDRAEISEGHPQAGAARESADARTAGARPPFTDAGQGEHDHRLPGGAVAGCAANLRLHRSHGARWVSPTCSIHRFTAYPGCEYHDVAVKAGRSRTPTSTS